MLSFLSFWSFFEFSAFSAFPEFSDLVCEFSEIYDFLRLLYARVGEAYSHVTGKKMTQYTEAQIQQNIIKKFTGKKIALLSPAVRSRKGHYRELFEQIRKKGYTKARVDGEIVDLKPGYQVDRYKVHDIEIVIDRIALTKAKKEIWL